MNNFIFGPVNSRRLGLSLGIDLIPEGQCNFDCIYCEVGNKTTSSQRREYSPTNIITREIDSYFQDPPENQPIDIITITASGEPTLHTGLGDIIRHIKTKIAKPVAVLTNGSLLHEKSVRRELEPADLVIPSLDAARPASFRRINRPARGIEINDIITGLSQFKKEFGGTMWLEILLASKINDHPDDIRALTEAINRIKPDRIQLNTVVRPPLEQFARPLSREEMEQIAGELPEPVEIIAKFTQTKQIEPGTASPSEIINMLQRRPCTAEDIYEALNLAPAPASKLLHRLEEEGRIKGKTHQGKTYFHAALQNSQS